MLYTVGSFAYLLSALVGFQLKKTRLIDPLADYHHKIHSHFLVLNKKPKNLIPLIHVIGESKIYKRKTI